MKAILIVLGGTMLLAPLVYQRSMRRIRVILTEQGGDLDRFDRMTNQRWIRAFVVLVVPLAGVLVIVLGVTGA